MKAFDIITKLLNENDNDNIIMYDENDNPTEFEQVAVVPFQEKIYIILHPVIPLPGMDKNDALVFSLEFDGDNSGLRYIDDESIIDQVFDVYYQTLKENETLN